MSRRQNRNDRYEEMKRKLRRLLERLARRIGLPTGPASTMADDALLLFYKRGDTIFAESQKHDFSYVAVEGIVRLECRDHRRNPITVQLVREGHLFGVSWLPRRRPRALRAVAHTDVTVALLDQHTIARLLAQVDHARMNLFSYSARALSVLVVQKAALRTLPAAERLLASLRALIADFGRVEGNQATLTIPLTCVDLGMLIGASKETIRHLLSKLKKKGVLWREKGFLAMRHVAHSSGDGNPREPYQGVNAEWARPKLGDLLGRCGHLGLNERAADYIRRTAVLYAVPDEALLLPPGSDNAIAFVVSGSAWLEPAGSSGEHFALQLIPRGQFVRLPTRPSSRGTCMRARAHRSCVVGLLTSEQMSEAMSLLPVDNQLILFDVTTRALSRQLCDCTTAPTRGAACRLLTMFGFLAHDFGSSVESGISINVDLSCRDLARLLGVDPATIRKASKRLRANGWIEQVADERYVLLRVPPGQGSNTDACSYCK